MNSLRTLLLWSTLITVTTSVKVTDIQGNAWLSPFAGQTVSNVTGVITAKGGSGFYISGEAVDDDRVSNGLFIFSTSSAVLGKINVGDMVSVTGKVAEFRSSSSPNDLLQTEISSPSASNVVVLSSGNNVSPVILGRDRSPPTELLSALDIGADGWLSAPNNQSLVDTVNATLQPDLYGMDFWSSLEGQLVTVPSPVALDFQNSFGEFWVHGDWPVTGKNGRGGLTITINSDNVPDANPETVIIGSPLDGSSNPEVAVGTTLSDITGVVQYQFGFYYILPLTAPTVLTSPDSTVPPSIIVASDDHCELTFGDYNVENMAPTSAHLPTVAGHIANFLLTPDILFLQEIQDNSGPTNDGVVIANLTLSTLVKAIADVSNVTYDFVEIAPVNNQDGGQPGGNIRQVYLYRPDKLSLVSGSPAGESLDSVEVVSDYSGKPSLNFNPGRIDPTNAAWTDSRKPLVAQWQTPSGSTLFTVNVHFTSKGGSSSTQGNARPPVNLPVATRTTQVELAANFIKTVLDADSEANVILAGDFNEFSQTRSVFASLNGVMTEIDEVAGIPLVERYTYVFDQNTEQLDHSFISSAIANRTLAYEHIHVNNWSPSLSARVSDHDPSVGKVRLC
ncbi:DNase I-like protein [Dendrothele bispora CBS 962.96]|uniref:DNase I-like protein n=1 Tax=Dendrothele bispora (strain CBS 962.96) TaxID=1314807 RepID=A0A4S8MQD8_DENBC|nr:DNase I-like protein [Dendrothele bispora CBS 962.96]